MEKIIKESERPSLALRRIKNEMKLVPLSSEIDIKEPGTIKNCFFKVENMLHLPYR
jgi:hypothetical protein